MTKPLDRSKIRLNDHLKKDEKDIKVGILCIIIYFKHLLISCINCITEVIN